MAVPATAAHLAQVGEDLRQLVDDDVVGGEGGLTVLAGAVGLAAQHRRRDVVRFGHLVLQFDLVGHAARQKVLVALRRRRLEHGPGHRYAKSRPRLWKSKSEAWVPVNVFAQDGLEDDFIVVLLEVLVLVLLALLGDLDVVDGLLQLLVLFLLLLLDLAAHLLQQRVVETLHQVGVLHVAAQEFRLLDHLLAPLRRVHRPVAEPPLISVVFFVLFLFVTF